MRHNRERLKHLIVQLRRLQIPAFQVAHVAISYLHSAAAINKELLSKSESRAIKRAYKSDLQLLLEFGALEKMNVADIPVYKFATIHTVSTEEVVCAVDPFCYISHLSAMAWHGLTDRLPRTAFISRPDNKTWRELAVHHLKYDLGEWYSVYSDVGLPGFKQPEFKKVSGKPVSVWTSARLNFSAAHKRVEDGHIRVATVGRCFLDMVRQPKLCGGIYHVLETYEEHAKLYLEQIVHEINSHGTKIEQARAGYLLEEVAHLTHPLLDEWASRATRGGSRKLDSNADYSDKFSERWALSLNI